MFSQFLTVSASFVLFVSVFQSSSVFLGFFVFIQYPVLLAEDNKLLTVTAVCTTKWGSQEPRLGLHLPVHITSFHIREHPSVFPAIEMGTPVSQHTHSKQCFFPLFFCGKGNLAFFRNDIFICENNSQLLIIWYWGESIDQMSGFQQCWKAALFPNWQREDWVHPKKPHQNCLFSSFPVWLFYIRYCCIAFQYVRLNLPISSNWFQSFLSVM